MSAVYAQRAFQSASGEELSPTLHYGDALQGEAGGTREKMGKGVTLSKEELLELKELLNGGELHRV